MLNRIYNNFTHLLCSSILACVALMSVSSCQSTHDISYFQDITTESGNTLVQTPKDLTIKPNDEISIIVTSRDPLLSDMFNLPYVTRQLGMKEGTLSAQNQGVLTYVVSPEGDIDFPIVGKIHVAGLTRSQIAEKIKNILIKDKLIKDPVVTVQFSSQSYLVMGEVNLPGRKNITRDRTTLLDAITAAGDLTINGLRKNVKVVRNNNGNQETYIVDLTSAESVSQSPAFYVQQDDIIYIEPNDQRKRQATVNGNTPLSYSFWVSVASLMVSVAVLIWK